MRANVQLFEDVSTSRAMTYQKVPSSIFKANGIFCNYVCGIQVFVIAAKKIVG